MRLFPLSYNGFDLTPYHAYFENPFGFSLQSQGSFDVVPRTGDYPIWASKSLQHVYLQVKMAIEDCPPDSRNILTRYMDVGITEPKKLVAVDMDTNRLWYVYAVPLGMATQDQDGKGWTTSLIVPNPIWYADDVLTESRTVNASGQQLNLAVGGNTKSKPVISITPVNVKASGFAYARFIIIRNQTARTFADPIDVINIVGTVLDTSLLIPAKMQALGEDLRVYMDGSEIDRWLDGINTANTKVWCNIPLSPKQEFTLAVAIAPAGAIASITVNESISSMPDNGILLIASEVFTYTSKSVSAKRFDGVTRASKFTAAAAHIVGVAVYWLEHEIWMYYGNAVLTTPITDDTKKPIINLNTSTNLSWGFADFGDATWQRTGRWSIYGSDYYTASHEANASPFSGMGLINYNNGSGALLSEWWSLYHPAGITVWNFSSGEIYRDTSRWFKVARLEYSNDGTAWTTALDITTPVVVSNWEAWSDAGVLGATYLYVRMYVQTKTSPSGSGHQSLEVADVILTLDATGIPIVSLGAENASAYALSTTITNINTGESIALNYVMSLNETLEVDCEEKTVTYLKDGSNAFSALVVSNIRFGWLDLLPDETNVLQYDETGVVNVTWAVAWRDRNN